MNEQSSYFLMEGKFRAIRRSYSSHTTSAYVRSWIPYQTTDRRQTDDRRHFYTKVMDGQGTTWRKNIAENFNSLSRVHERYRRQTDRQTDGRWHIANVDDVWPSVHRQDSVQLLVVRFLVFGFRETMFPPSFEFVHISVYQCILWCKCSMLWVLVKLTFISSQSQRWSDVTSYHHHHHHHHPFIRH